MPQIELRGQRVQYAVRVSKRAKRISLRCSQADGLELVYPHGMTDPPAEELLRQKCDWVLASIEKLQAAREQIPKRDYVDGELFQFRGSPLVLKSAINPQLRRATVEIEDGIMRLACPDGAHTARYELMRIAVADFYREQAREYLPRRACQLATVHRFAFASVRIKNQKTRWGSCSAKRNINLNLRLMMAPDEAIDYVIIHELCHLHVMDHSRAFWNLVESHCPDYRQWRAWFKQHGPSLIL